MWRAATLAAQRLGDCRPADTQVPEYGGAEAEVVPEDGYEQVVVARGLATPRRVSLGPVTALAPAGLNVLARSEPSGSVAEPLKPFAASRMLMVMPTASRARQDRDR
jgi:hypothetical protein